MIMRSLILGAALFALTSCGPGASLLDRGVALASGQEQPTARPAGQFPPRFAALIANQSVPALVLTVEERNQVGRLLRESRINGVDTWLSSDIVALMLEDGFLQGTRGLGSELFAADVSQPKSLVLSARGGYSDRLHSNLTGNDQIETRAYRCLVESGGSAVISLEAGQVPTRIMTEDCKSLDQSFRNTYWIGTNSGVIVQSRQWAGEKLGYIKTQAAVRKSAAPAAATPVVVVGAD